jgi:pyrophosphatase PpaX
MRDLHWPVVLFDLDGTVLDTIELIRASHEHAVRTVLGREMTDEELMAGIGTPLRAQMETFDRERAQELYDVYRAWNHANTARLARRYDGVDEVLLSLEEAGARLGIVTSKSRDAVDLVLTSLPAPVVWDVVITHDDSDLHKPHPAPLLTALERLGAEPGQAVYVGDSPFDLEAAHAAGCTAIGVAWGAFRPDVLADLEPHAVVGTPAELTEVLFR